jgi:hypothetical protein
MCSLFSITSVVHVNFNTCESAPLIIAFVWLAFTPTLEGNRFEPLLVIFFLLPILMSHLPCNVLCASLCFSCMSHSKRHYRDLSVSFVCVCVFIVQQDHHGIQGCWFSARDNRSPDFSGHPDHRQFASR